ncbi:nascent polypeptide-associated complex protein [Stetteria hydrogenophila]
MVALPLNPRDIERILKRMGIAIEELDATRVAIELVDGRTLEVSEPRSVMLLKAKGQPPMIYVIGEPREVEAKREEASGGEAFSEEDVELVAEQAGVSREEARKALEEAGGDIARAILSLQEKKGGQAGV